LEQGVAGVGTALEVTAEIIATEVVTTEIITTKVITAVGCKKKLEDAFSKD
jgi:hypothetical protein